MFFRFQVFRLSIPVDGPDLHLFCQEGISGLATLLGVSEKMYRTDNEHSPTVEGLVSTVRSKFRLTNMPMRYLNEVMLNLLNCHV